MGFMDGVGKFLAGKPVFEDPAGNQQSAAPSPTSSYPTKRFPVVAIEHISCEEQANLITCSLLIKNQSSEEIFVDKVRILGVTKELDFHMRAGESKQCYSVYRGQKPTNSSNAQCLLDYRDNKGDYLQSAHMIQFEFQQSGHYLPKSIRFVGPIRDI